MQRAFFDLCKYGKGYLSGGNNTSILNSINNIILEETIPEVMQYEQIKNILSINANINLNQTNYSRVLPLHLACKYKKIEIVNLLIAHGANVNIKSTCPNLDDFRDMSGNVPKVFPIYFSFIGALVDVDKTLSLVNVLLDAGSQLNDGQFSPLFLSMILFPERNLFDYLIQYGADINEVDEAGNSFLMMLMREYVGIDCDNPLTILNAIQRVIKHGININQINIHGETALKLAAEFNVPVMPYLLKNGADLNLSNSNLLLFYSIRNGELYTTRLLLKKGVSATTGLYYLVNKVYLAKIHEEHSKEFFEDRAKEFFFLFLEYGANVNQLHFLDNTYHGGNKESDMIRLSLIKLMLDHGAEKRISINTEAKNIAICYENYPPENAAMIVSLAIKRNADVINLVENYQPNIMSLKQSCVISLFKNKRPLPVNASELPEEILNLLKGFGEEPNTTSLFHRNERTNSFNPCNIQ